MSTTVDQRVVSLKFDNSQFEQNVQVSLTTLDKLKASLNFGKEANKSFSNIEAASNNVKMSGLSAAIQNVKMQFSSLDVIAATALGNITNTVLNKTKSIIGGALDSVVGGGIRRAQNLEKAYFMLNGIFKETGTTATKTAQVMNAVNKAVDGTAYSLDEAAVVASQLAASQIEVTAEGGQMLSTLQSIAGVAATTSSSFNDIGTIFATVAGNGRLMGDQLLQLSYRGINAAQTIANFTGNTEQEIRDMVSKGQVSFETFAAAMQDAFGDQATKANLTFTGALANTKSALARIGADVATPAMENLRKVLLSLKTAIDVVHEVLRPFLEHINTLIEILSNKAISRLNKFNNAFANVFEVFTNAKGNEKVLSLGYKIGDVANNVDKLNDRGAKLTRTLAGLFAALDSVRIILGMAFNIAMIPFRPLLTIFGKVNDGLLTITASVGDTIVAFRDKLQSISDKLTIKLDKLNGGIVALINGFISWVKESSLVGKAMKNIFGFTDKGSKAVEKFSDIFKLSTINVKTGEKEYTKLGKALKSVTSAFEKITDPISNYFHNLKTGMEPAKAFSTMLKEMKKNIDVATVINTISEGFAKFGEVLSTIFDRIKEFFSGDIDANKELKNLGNTTKDISDNLTKSTSAIDAFRSALEKLSNVVKKNVTGNFGIGEGLAILFGISLILAIRKFSKAIGGLAPITNILGKISGILGELKSAINEFRFVMVAKQLTTFTLALTALVLALKQLAELPVENVKTAGTVVAVIAGVIGSIAIALTAISTFGGKGGDTVKKTAKGASVLTQIASLLMAVAVAIGVLAAAIKYAGSLDMYTMRQGLAAIGISLAAITTALILLSKFSKPLIMSSKLIWGLTGAILALVVAISVLNNITIDASIIGKLAVLMSMVGMLMGVIVLLSYLNKKGLTLQGGKAMLGILALSGALLVLVVSLKILQKLDVSAIINNIAGLSGIFFALIGAMVVAGIAGKYAIQGGVGLLAMSASLGLLVIVIKMISRLKPDEILYGLVVIKLLTTFFTKLIFITNFAGKNAAKAGVTLISFAAAMLLLTACIAVLSHISLEGLAKGIIAIDAIGAMMAGLIYITKYSKITKSVQGTILMLALTIGVMSASIGVLSMINTSKVMGAVAALTITMAAFGGLMYLTKSLNVDKQALANMAALAGVIAVLGSVLAILASLPLKNTIAAAGALTGSLLAFSAAVSIINTIGKFSVESLKSMSYILILVGMMSAFMLILSEIKIAPGTAKALATMGGVMVSFGIVVAVLGRVYKSGSAGAVLEGVGVIMAVILGLGIIAAGLGALQKYVPEVEDFINRGAKVFAAIGGAIGAIFGGLVNGFLTYASAGIANMGLQLSAFAENASGFFTAMKGIDPSVAEGAKNMAKAIAYLTGADFIGKLSEFVTGKKSFDGFGKQLSGFTDALVSYNNAVGGVTWNTEAIEASTDAALALADVAKAAPAVGGLAQLLSGTKGLNKGFSEQFTTFAENIIACSNAFSGVTINVDAIKNAASAGKALAELVNTLPKEVVIKIGEFSLAISGADLGTFGDKLGKLGSGLTNFSKNTAEITDISGIKKAAQACSILASAASTISSISIIDWAGTSRFSSNAGSFGTGLSNFSKNVKDVDPSKIKQATQATKDLAEAIKTASKISSGGNLSGFKDMASNLGKAISEAAKQATAKAIKVTQKVNVKTKANIDMSSIRKAFNNMDTSSAKKAGEKLAKACKTAMAGVKGWRKIGENAGQGFVNGVKSKLNSSSAAGRAIANAAYRAAMRTLKEKSPSRVMKEVGSYAGEGFVIGLQSWVGSAYDSGEAIAVSATEGISKSIKSVYDVLDSNIESNYSPVITPVMNLSEIQNGIDMFNTALDFSKNNAFSVKSSMDLKSENMTDTIVRGIKEAFADQNSGITEAITEGIYTLSTPLKQGMVEAVDGMGIAVDGRQFGRVVRRSAGI